MALLKQNLPGVSLTASGFFILCNMKEVRYNLLLKKDGVNALILLRFNFKAKRFQISTGFTIPVKYWNENTQRCKEVAAFPFAKQINARLNKLEFDTLMLFYDYVAEGIVPTLTTFKKEWIKRTTNKDS